MKRINKLKILLLILTICILFLACRKVPAGYVGIKVYLLGNDKGVDAEELSPGLYHIGMYKELYIFPTFQQNYVWTKDKNEGSPNDESITFQTNEGLGVSADVGISYHLNPEKISAIFQKYRKGIDEITDIYMRNYVRDALNSVASQYSVETVYGKGKTDLLNEVENEIKKELEDEGIIVDKLYWIGSIRLPEEVRKALDEKVKATQRAQQRENELREAEAEAKKKIAQAEGEAQAMVLRAKAEAESLRLKSMYLSGNIIKYEATKKWDGKLPNVTSGVMPFIEVK